MRLVIGIVAVAIMHLSAQSYATELINRAKRTQLIELAGLTEETARWDELEKDLLVMRAKGNGTDALLQKRYPTLPTKKLQKLHVMATEVAP